MRALTPDQIRLRAELAAAQEQIVALLRSAVGDSLAPEEAQAVAEEARAWRGANAFRLVRYLSDRPDALSAPSSHCPTCVLRLLTALTAAGHGDKVTLVACGDCGRTAPLPTRTGPEGRLCSRCAGRRAKKPCARCGNVTTIYVRRPEGGICAPCRKKEPDAKEECAGCRRMMISYRRLPDGTNLCQTCAPKNAQTCCRCGRVRRVNAQTSDGPVCGGCYSSPARLCGVCGRIVPIVVRADGTRPDTCERCYKRHEKTCAVCERVRPGHHINGGLGPFHCDTCRPREECTCALCGQVAKVKVFWPRGPVCDSCYRTALSTPAPCASCSRDRVLIGQTAEGNLLCKACSFPDEPVERCSTCGEPADLYAGHRCPRCTLTARVTDLLSTDGASVAEPLQPLVLVLTSAQYPYRVLRWLRRSPTAQLLGRLALDPGALNHESLDRLPQGAATAYVRGSLVTAGILPPRDENLALLTNWVARTVAELPARQANLIRPFAEWHIIRDARRRSARGRYTYAAHKGDCSNVLAAIDLLNWLDSQNLNLRRLQQPHLDTWATDRPTLRTRSIPFLRWSTARRLCPPGVIIDRPASQLPGHFQAEDDARNELLRCLNDTALPLDVRVAAALVRLYALPLTRIVELTEDHISRDREHTCLAVNQHPFVLPPKLARLIDDQLRHSTPRHSTTAGRRYLLPGQIPGRPRNPLGLADTLRQHGLPARAARNTAMVDALPDLPPMVIADLLGIHPKTAERWATLAGENWSDYLSSLT
ncbi:XRE family transcriptional regulator [Streptomyces hyaluromycini]|uniref:XRE family transcriptional regulator n=1 Tax=Streptomyces hyaluromycini TaxID=1377993 RepID=A0ABV1X427_9ACTN